MCVREKESELIYIYIHGRERYSSRDGCGVKVSASKTKWVRERERERGHYHAWSMERVSVGSILPSGVSCHKGCVTRENQDIEWTTAATYISSDNTCGCSCRKNVFK